MIHFGWIEAITEAILGYIGSLESEMTILLSHYKNACMDDRMVVNSTTDESQSFKWCAI